MTAEKEPVDLRKIEPVVRGDDPTEMDTGDTDRDGVAASATTGATPSVAIMPEDENAPPPDPDDLERLRRG